MELSANDVRTFEFPTQLRGYDKHAVDTFKEQVAGRIEQLKQELIKATAEMESQRTQLNGLKQFEDAIKNAAIDARKNADATLANAKKEAEQLLSHAQAEAAQILGTKSQQREELESQITKLELTRKSYLSKFHALIVSHLEWVQELANSEGAGALPGAADSGKLEITATSELMGARRESIAGRPTKQGIVTEEANAASPIVQVTAQTGRIPVQPEPTPTPQPQSGQSLDPELAAALESYRRLAEARSHHEPIPTAPLAPKMPDHDSFVPAPNQAEHYQSTDKMKVAEPSYQQVLDKHIPNLDIEVSAGTPEPTQPPTPAPAPTAQPGGDISDMLDRVARAFEDEMDKASKS